MMDSWKNFQRIGSSNTPPKWRVFLWLLAPILAGLVAPAYGAGTIPYSLSQQIGANGTPLSGCKLYLYQAGTVAAPQNAYSDTALTLALPNPIICDAFGRLPQFFLADGLIKIRLSDKNGVTQVTADNIQVIGASSGGGGGGSIDATTILATGDLKSRYGTGALSGFVRANGRTIGSATSGATERANSDTQALFEHLWGVDANLSVSGGRGGTANADWVANKTLALPDWRGRVIAGLDDMGAPSALRLSLGMLSTTLGAAGGEQTHTLTTSEMPLHTHTGTTGGETALHTHPITVPTTTTATAVITNGVPSASFWSGSVSSVTGTENVPHLHTFTTNAAGGGAAHNVIQPTMLATIYVKL